MWLLIILGLATSTLSLTLSRAKIGTPVRSWAEYKAPWLAYLLHCPYCLSFWFGCFLVLTTQQIQVNWVVDTLAVVALSGLVNVLLINFMFTGQPEIDRLVDALELARGELELRTARAHQEDD